jgi:hypothetical protein
MCQGGSRTGRGDRAAQAEARQIVKESVENRGAWREGQGWAMLYDA